MRRRKSDIPVGATWRAVGSRGDIGIVRLENRHENGCERWVWEFCHADGSGRKSDWTPTRRLAVAECGWCIGENVRFKRVKNEDEP